MKRSWERIQIGFCNFLDCRVMDAENPLAGQADCTQAIDSDI